MKISKTNFLPVVDEASRILALIGGCCERHMDLPGSIGILFL
jgi:hypothetical protein